MAGYRYTPLVQSVFSTVRVGTHTVLSEQLEKGSSSSDEVGYFHPGLSYTKGYFKQCQSVLPPGLLDNKTGPEKYLH